MVLLWSGVSDLFAITTCLMIRCGSSTSSRLSSLAVAESRENVSAARCFIYAGCMKSKSNSSKKRNQLACLLVKSTRLSINSIASHIVVSLDCETMTFELWTEK